uniref:ribonuclease H n=1 Tax=Cacopsylla melanoneura TaxID=428564 RepID=A0A8D8R1P1_9HEMI
MGFKIEKKTSSWHVEILAIYEALKYLQENHVINKQIKIVTDSMSSIQSISNNNWKNNNIFIVTEIKKILKILMDNNEIKLVWVPGHEGIKGNEEADRIAGQAITDGTIYPFKEEGSYHLETIKQQILREFVRWYKERGENIGKQFVVLNPDFRKTFWFNENMNRKFITIIERLRIGHALCPVYLNKIELLPHISTLPVNVEFLVFSELSIIKRKLYYYIQKQNIDL